MRKISSRFFFVALAGILLIPAFAFAQNSNEKIHTFYESAYINPDGTVKVTEKIVYDFGTTQKHGIYRDIPMRYSINTDNISTAISGVTVKDEQGTPYTFTLENKGDDLEIKIGNADTTITGIHTYIISYTIAHTMGYFDTYDEWYWNVTGNEWQVPIDEIDARVYLSQPLEGKNIRLSCYVGAIGSTESCNSTSTTTSALVSSVDFNFTQPLSAGEGFTIAVGFPKGIVHQPTLKETIIRRAQDNGIVVVPFITFFVMLFIWNKKGKDPRGRGTIIPEYESPDNITPLEASMILHQAPRNKDISAEIIYLATRGFITIKRTEGKGFLTTKVDYELIKNKNSSEAKNLIDKALLTALYNNDSENTVKLSDLKNNFFTNLPSFKKAVTDSVVTKGYYPTNPQRVILKYIIIAIVLDFIGFMVVSLLGIQNTISLISFTISTLIIIAFAFVMPKVTELGALTKERIKGLKIYITVAEKERIKFHNAPAKSPELFETLLPYAMVLGSEGEWSKQFEGIYTTPPQWYQGSYNGMFNAVIFTNSLSSFNSVVSSTVVSAPRGGSGSGGGGFSGGGFGGGGGGSW